MIKLLQLIYVYWRIKIKRLFPFLISKEEKQAIDNVNEINRRLKKGNRKMRRATKAWLRKNL